MAKTYTFTVKFRNKTNCLTLVYTTVHATMKQAEVLHIYYAEQKPQLLHHCEAFMFIISKNIWPIPWRWGLYGGHAEQKPAIMHRSAWLRDIYTVCTSIVYNLTTWRLSLRWSNKTDVSTTAWLYSWHIYYAEQKPDALYDSKVYILIYAIRRSGPLHDCKIHTSIFIMQNRRQTICMAVLFDNYHARQRSNTLHDCKATYLPCRTESRPFFFFFFFFWPDLFFIYKKKHRRFL